MGPKAGAPRCSNVAPRWRSYPLRRDHAVEAPEDGHRDEDVADLRGLVGAAKQVGNAEDEGRELVEGLEALRRDDLLRPEDPLAEGKVRHSATSYLTTTGGRGRGRTTPAGVRTRSRIPAPGPRGTREDTAQQAL